MLRLAKYLKYFKAEVIVGPFFKLLEAIFELIVPLVMAQIIDVGIKNRDKAYVLQRGGIILLLGVMGLIFALICQYSAARASQGFGTRVRDDLFAHINSLSHAELDKLGTNFLITVITNDVNQMQLAVAMLIRLVVRAPFLVIGAAVMAMFLDLRLSLIFLIVIPFVSFVLYYVMKKSVPFYKLRQKAVDKISLITRESLSGVRVIRAFSRQEKEKKRFEEANDDVAQIAIRVGKLSAFLNPATFAILNAAILAIIWFGGARVNIGDLSQGEVIAFINYMTQISLALVVVANLVVIFTKAAASAARINQVFDMTNTLKDGSLQTEEYNVSHGRFLLGQHNPAGAAEFSYDTNPGGPLPGQHDSAGTVGHSHDVNPGGPLFVFDHVSFAYPDSKGNSLEDISFCVNEGETIGIIGGTGSGKSTLINLLPRFYDVTEGKILFHGKPLPDYSIKALRGQFGIVPQKAVLFYGSVMDNLRYSKADATPDELKKVVEIAQAKEFVEKLPEGYDTLIMQDGKNLSGGQRQRLTIARALAGNPRILILDDSFSALDYATDARLRKALKENCSGMTIFMVSQRANSIMHADQIIVLEDGKLAGIGKHEELIKFCEVYKEICQSQLNSQEVGR